jgi:hypothetical protein
MIDINHLPLPELLLFCQRRNKMKRDKTGWLTDLTDSCDVRSNFFDQL